MDPISYEESVNCSNKANWMHAVNKEINSTEEKRDAEGNADSYKARLVAQGCSQIERVDL